MEKYEINKYLNTFETWILDIYQALKIEDIKDKYEKLSKITSDMNLWNDPDNANKVIKEFNEIKEKISIYNEMNNKLKDMKDIIDLIDEEEYKNLLEDEIISFEKRKKELDILITLSGKYDNMGVIMEFHPGAGGTESMDWALMLYRMYQRYCQLKGFKFNTIDYQPGEAGIKSATVEITGSYAYGLLKSERGVHRLVRISPFDSNKRRHTSFSSIDIAPVIDNDNTIEIKDEDIRVDTYCSSGAGGQGVNTTYSAVRITHLPTNIVITCQNERSQIKNKETALKVLKSKLFELKIQQEQEELRKLKGEQLDIGWGSQIRSYVFCPYTLVKDHRTEYETGNIQSVMDGNIDEFITAYLKLHARG